MVSFFVCCFVLLNVVCLGLQHSSRAYSIVPPPRDNEEKEAVHRMLRVDHAGEYGANRIYAGQMAVLGRSRTGPLIQVWKAPGFKFCFVSEVYRFV